MSTSYQVDGMRQPRIILRIFLESPSCHTFIADTALSIGCQGFRDMDQFNWSILKDTYSQYVFIYCPVCIYDGPVYVCTVRTDGHIYLCTVRTDGPFYAYKVYTVMTVFITTRSSLLRNTEYIRRTLTT